MLLRRRRTGVRPAWHRERSIRGALETLPAEWHVAFDDGLRVGEHVAVGPSGVFAIHSNADSAQLAAERLNLEIEQGAGIALWVKPVAVTWDAGEDDAIAEDEGVAYVEGANLASWLAAIPGWLTSRQRSAIEQALDAEYAALRR